MRATISPYLPITWASDIRAESWSEEELLVTGKLPILDSDLQPSRDAFQRYLSSVKLEFGQKGTALPSPHVTFANAVSDEALIAFVREFGPVATKAVVEGEQPQTEGLSLSDLDKLDWRTSIGAIQDLPTLRRERQTYASALELLAELRRGEDAASIKAIQQHVSGIADGVWYWPEEWDAERQWRISHSSASVTWHFEPNRRDYIMLLKTHVFHPDPINPDPPQDFLIQQDFHKFIGTLAHSVAWSNALTIGPFYYAAHQVLCTLINAFDTKVQFIGDRAVEALPFGSLRFGIRPALYLILKHLYLGRAGTQVCGNDRCRRFFESAREGQVYCSIECSQRYRQRQYWAKAGAERRNRRRAKKSSRKNTPRP